MSSAAHAMVDAYCIALFRTVPDALDNFNQALSTMGLENEVTIFTASDFGRTLTINGNGSDHGWGGHYMVMGGAVNGGQLYGEWPDYNMGLSNSDLLDVFPDLDRFDAGWQTHFGLFG